MSAEDLREPETMNTVMGSLRAVHESQADLPTSFDSFRVVEEYRETAAGRGGEIPAAYDEAGSGSRARWPPSRSSTRGASGSGPRAVTAGSALQPLE